MVMNDPWGIFNDPFFIGWNDTLSRLNSVYANNNTYPPYDIVKQDEETYRVDVALAGFGEDNINISVDNKTLIIKGDTSTNKDENIVHKGIATRKFTRTFSLGEFMEVTNAEFENGLLSITIEKIVPEEKQPKQIKINTNKQLTD